MGLYHAAWSVGWAMLPAWTFFFFAYVHGIGHLINTLIDLTDATSTERANSLLLQTFFTAVTFSISFYLWNRRRVALKEAQELIDAGAKAYDLLWGEYLTSRTFQEELHALERSWQSLMQSLVPVPRRQMSASDIGDLFLQADRLNDHFQRKLCLICKQHGGQFFYCEVKAESRTLQKMYRAYGGDWRSLCDIVRTSLLFADLSSLTACLEAIAADPEVKLVRVHNDKMRFRHATHAKATGGYRDVQLSMMLDTPETRSLGVDKHVAEVQLHLRDMIALKTDGGHANYVLCRNLRGQ